MEIGTKIHPKSGKKRVRKSVFGRAPGRGVLRFSGGGIQESRSFLGQKRAKNRKIDRLRG